MTRSKRITRRRFLQLTGAILIAGAGGSLWSLLQSFSKPTGSTLLKGSGPLSDAERERLWELAVFVGQTWDLGSPAEIQIRKATFMAMFDAKVARPISYVGEYRNALSLLSHRETVSLREAPRSRLEHARYYVVREFAQLHLVLGGHLSVGYPTFFGHPTGPLEVV